MRRSAGRADGRTVTRREAIAVSASVVAGLALSRERGAVAPDHPSARPPGRLKQSVSRWPYRQIPLPEFTRAAAAMGLAAIDLLGPEDWDPVREAGLVCSMGYPTARRDFIATGLNDRANHRMLLRELEETLPVPGRHELDGTQELNWRAVASAIADTAFAGFVAHEFVPTRDPLTSLREAVAVCNV